MSMASISAFDGRRRLRRIVARSAVVAATVMGLAAIGPSTARAQVPTINIRETCRAAAAVMVSLMGGSTTRNDVDICLESENKARQQMIKDWSTYQTTDRSGCIVTHVYLPSYTEWLTCFEMNRAVRQGKLQGQSMKGLTNPDGSMTMPKLSGTGTRSRNFGP
jgi:hypothetical protein